MTIAETGAALRSGNVSCVELARDALSRADRDTCNSFITLTREEALQTASERDRELATGMDRGPLHGIPFALKDIIHAQGVRTTAASPIYRNSIAQSDSDVTARLKAAGAVLIGKTNLHELAMGATSQSKHFGPVVNPHAADRIAGGSSGGSATAVASGIVPLALGTDTGGSIRIPASYCGIVGFKPTYGRVSRRGVLPLAFSLDHVGPMAATVDDCEVAMHALAGNWRAANHATLEGLKICLPENFFFEGVDTAVTERVKHVVSQAADAGAVIQQRRVPDLHLASAAARVIQYGEFASLYARYEDPSLFGADVWAILEQAKQFFAHEYVNAQRLRSVFRREFDEFWKGSDVIAAPATPITAPLASAQTVQIGGKEEDARLASTRLVRPIAFLGEPAISLPCGTHDGLPIGLQLIAKPGADEELLKIARLFEGLA